MNIEELTTDQKKQIEILDRKLSVKVNNSKTTVQEALKKIEEQELFMNDYIASPGIIQFDTTGTYITAGVQGHSFTMHRNAVSQLAAKYKIPGKYLTDKATGTDWERKLAAHTLQEHSKNASQEVLLLRTVNDEIRGVLSNSYDRYSSLEVYKAFISGAREYPDAIICDAHHDDLSGYIEIVRSNIVPLRLKNDEVTYVVFGAQIRNSDFGCGALDVKLYFIQVACWNGMTRQSMIRKIHRGSAIDVSGFKLSKEALAADAHAKKLIVRDCMSSAFNQESINAEVNRLERAAGYEIDMVKEFQKLPQVGMLQSEVEMLERKFIENNPEDGLTGGNTLWKLAQGISAVGNAVPDLTRKRDLWDIAGKMFDRVNIEDAVLIG